MSLEGKEEVSSKVYESKRGRKKRKLEENGSVEEGRVLRSDAKKRVVFSPENKRKAVVVGKKKKLIVEQRESVGTDKKEVAELSASKENAVIKSGNGIKQKKSGKIVVQNKRVTRLSASKLNEEGRKGSKVDKKKIGSKEEPDRLKKIAGEVAIVGKERTTKKKDRNVDASTLIKVDKKMVGSSICKKKEEPESAEKKITSEDSGVGKKKVRGLGLKRKIGGKASTGGTSRKKTKTEASKCCEDQSGEIDGKKLKTGSTIGKGLGPKAAVCTASQKNSPAKKRMKRNLIKGSRPGVERNRLNEGICQMTLKELKDNAAISVGAGSKELDISNGEEIKVQGTGRPPGRGRGRPPKGQMTLKMLKNNAAIPIGSGSEELDMSRGKKIKAHSRGRPPGRGRGRPPKGPMTLKMLKNNAAIPIGAGSEELDMSDGKKIKVHGRGRPLGRGRGRPARGRGRPARFLPSNKKVIGFEKTHIEGEAEVKNISSEPRIGHKVLSQSQESKNADTLRGKTEVMVSGESKSYPLTKQNKERSMAKKKLKDQIKGMLFSVGWKIDLRPRKGKNCIDTVYLCPRGHTHWSILKAYDALQHQCKNHNDIVSDLSREPRKKSKKKHSVSFAPIPMEALSILRHPISKRRSSKELKAEKERLGDESKSTKGKGGKRKRRAKQFNIVGSSTKDAVGSTGKKAKYRKKKKGCALLVRGINTEAENDSDVYVPYVWKRTIFSWMLDLEIMPENGTVKYMNRRRTKSLLEGRITRDGIYCSCCSNVLTVSKFEVHAGSKLCQPYQNIFVEEAGLSLLQCQINAWEKQESKLKGFYLVDIEGDDPNDDTCGICGDGGDLICCDGCPSTYHQSCLGTEMLPPGNWYCMNCTCRYCGVASGAVTQENGDDVSPLLSCCQCEEKYHQTCVPEGDAVPVSSDVSCISFCGQNCKKIFEKLRMLLGLKNDLGGGFSWTLVQRFDEDSLPGCPCGHDQRAECNSKIAVALAVMDECFLPIIDQRSGINLIHNVVYNCSSNFTRLSYRGFYTFILERDDEIISVATVRIHGIRVAEMPFIGTRNMYRRQGMCRRLLNEIEAVLCSLNIGKLIIPAISELMDTWTNVFGFKPLEISQKQDIRSVSLLVFPGTGLLVKALPERDSIKQCGASDEADVFEPERKRHHTPKATDEVCSDVMLEPHTSDDDIIQLQHKLEVKGGNPRFSLSGSCMDSSDERSSNSINGHETEFRAPEYKSSAIIMYENLSLQPDAASLNEPFAGNKTEKEASPEPEVKLPYEDIVHSDDRVAPNQLAVEEGFLKSSEQPNIHAVGEEGIVQEIHELDAEVVAVQSKPSKIDDAGYFEQNSSALNENSIPAYTLDSVKSVHVASGSKIQCSVVDKNSETLGSSSSSFEARDVMLNAANHSFHLVAAMSAITGITKSAFQEDIVVGTQDLRSETSLVVPGNGSTVLASENHATAIAIDGRVPNNRDITSGGLSNSLSESTLVVVNRDMPTTNATAVTIPAELSHNCCRGVLDANNSAYSGTSAVEPACCAPEVVTRSLEDGTPELVGASNVQHNSRFPCRFKASPSSVTPLSVVGGDSSEIHVVSKPN